jgi:hypothetical protein
MYSQSTKVLEGRIARTNKKFIALLYKSHDLLFERDTIVNGQIKIVEEGLRECSRLLTDVSISAANAPRGETSKYSILLNSIISDIKKKKGEKAILRRRFVSINRRIDTIARKVKESQNELGIMRTIKKEMEGRAVDPSSGISLKTLKQRLPTDVLTHIGKYLPYAIQFHLLEKKYNPIKRLTRLNAKAAEALYIKTIATPGILDNMSRGTIIHFRANHNRARLGFGIDKKTAIIKLINEMKKTCPDKALRLLKDLVILINPKKGYVKASTYHINYTL